VRGTGYDILPASNVRVVCCCDDCQAFADFLDNREQILDQFGGTDLLQLNQAQINIDTGREQLRSMRLRHKGLLRWYTGCCNTPVALTLNARMPFTSVVSNFISEQDLDTSIGTTRAWVQTQHAIGVPNYPHQSAKFPIGLTLRVIARILTWKIRGKHKPSTFFSDDGTPVAQPIIATET
jgi:hypothetical protein